MVTFKRIVEEEPQFPTVSICKEKENLHFNVLYLEFNSENFTEKWQNHLEIYNDTTYGKCIRFNSGKNIFGGSIQIKNTTYPGNDYGMWLDIHVPGERDFETLIIHIHNHSMPETTLSNKGFYISSG